MAPSVYVSLTSATDPSVAPEGMENLTVLIPVAPGLADTDEIRNKYYCYVPGSAEVVGLMCLKIFCNGEDKMYREQKSCAMRLGAAYQKINFLRNLKADFKGMNRTYFPGADPDNFTDPD